MFEAAELGSAIAKEAFDARVPALRVELVNAQYDLRHADFPVVVLLTGNDRAGVNETLNVLHEWMDARYLQTTAFGAEREDERERPRLWRYWNALPRDGQLAILVGDWATTLLTDRITDAIDDAAFERDVDHVECLERQLVDDGALLLKFWLHLPRKELKRRLKKARKEGRSLFRTEDMDRHMQRDDGKVTELAERLIQKTSAGAAPWHLIEASDPHYRDLSVAEGILAALRARLDTQPAAPSAVPAAIVIPDLDPRTSVVGSVDLSASLPYDEYKATLRELQERLRDEADRARRKGVSAILVFEGWDAAGKGGAIRRITHALDARDYHIAPVAAPTEEEMAHHYLWRFWRRIPRGGQIAIFDRSWYGRVLVERVEGLAREIEWRQAYAEINDFEEQLVEHGTVLCKFWLHIDRDEQLRRFREREKTPYKKYKITDEDYRNRDRWDEYVTAIDEMVARTSSADAPWHLIAANDKRFARVAIARTVCEALRAGVKRA